MCNIITSQDKNHNIDEVQCTLDEIVRNGARKMLQQAIRRIHK